MAPGQFLSEVHKLKDDQVPVKQAVAMVDSCFAQSPIFSQDVMANCLQRLCDLSPIPVLLLRTVLQTLKFYPTLCRKLKSCLETESACSLGMPLAFVVDNVLPKLITRKVRRLQLNVCVRMRTRVVAGVAAALAMERLYQDGPKDTAQVL